MGANGGGIARYADGAFLAILTQDDTANQKMRCEVVRLTARRLRKFPLRVLNGEASCPS